MAQRVLSYEAGFMEPTTLIALRSMGTWKYLYRAVEKEGKTVDFLLTARRDKAAAIRFFDKAMKANGVTEKVSIDKSGAN